MNDDISFSEAIAGMQALERRVAFEREVSSTPVGKQSFELRERARPLRERGDWEAAFMLHREAANLFPKDDPSAAAAMAWFDLGRCYEHKPVGVRIDNLRNAERLYRRALASPALPKDPHRMAMVRDALASCLRYLAYEVKHSDARKRLLDEAMPLFEKAVEIALKIGTAGFEDVVSFSHNLANCHAQCGNHTAALFSMDRAEAYVRRVQKLISDEKTVEYISRILFHAASHRTQRKAKGDLEQAKKQLLEVIEVGHPDWVDMAQMRLAALFLLETPPATEQAQAILRRVRVERIRPRALGELADHYARAGMRKEALVLFQGMLQSAMKHWRNAMADHIADHHVAEAQVFAHRAARLHLEEEDAFEAFFTLEDVSGLRFMENVEAFTRVQSSPVLRVLSGYYHARSAAAVMLENFSSRLVHGLVDIQTLVHEMRKIEIRGDDDGESRREFTSLVQILEDASHHPDAVGFLAEKAREVAEDAMRLHERMRQMDPSIIPGRHKPWLFRLTRDVVRKLLAEYPGHALVRLSLAEDLLVIVLWLEGDELKARHHRANVPKELFPRIARQRQNSKDAPLKLLRKIAKDFESIDLSPAFPPHRMAHAVLLPSYTASLLPLGALGPQGKTLLDQFDALSWTPSVAPLFMRQAAMPPRHGVVSVAPGGTLHHLFAFGLRLPSEVRIEGPEATEERVLATARTADVLCLYTHGKHAGERGPHVSLHGDESLGEPSPVAGWAGMERIELWACQSGVNLPTDPLVPHVDEAFGLDVEFVRNGVRSAIGTLWSVPDFVTACIVRTYRRGLRNGLPAPHALAEAQRFWRDEGIKSLLDHLTKATTVEAGLRAFKATLGGDPNEESHDADLMTFLGPAAAPREDPQRRMLEQLQRLAHPLAWAGFRFVGVHERRPTEPYNPDHFRPLTPDEMAEGKRIVEEALRKPAIEPKGRPLDEWVEEWLAEAMKLAPGESPSPEQAIRVARLYRDRLVSSHPHNLLAALAWLHEAMVTESQDSASWRHLALEAAWLWFEFARGDAIDHFQFLVRGPHPIALVRAERLLNGLPEDVHVWMLRSCIQMWRASKVHASDIAEVVERVWSVAKSVILSIRPENYEAMRTLTAAWEIPMFFPKLLDEAADLAAESIDDILDLPDSGKQVIGVLSRLRSTMAIVVMKRRPEVVNECDSRGALTPRELAREALRFGMASDGAKTFELPVQDKRFNRAWDALEGGLWGYVDDDRTPIWASTGTLDGAYRRLVASLFVGIAQAPGDAKDATQFLACLHPLCDLRLPLIRRWVCMMRPWKERLPLFFWVMAREREMVLAYLEDAALMCDLEAASKDLQDLRPHPLDPFQMGADEVEPKCTSILDILPWQIAHACSWSPPKELPNAHTTAFRAICSVEERTRALVSMWQGFLKASEKAMEGRDDPLPPISELFDPGIRLPNRRDLLRHAPPGAAVLGLAVEAGGHLAAALLWNTGNGVYEQVCLTEAKDGGRLQDLLAKLHIGPIAEEPLTRALAAGRTAVWNDVQLLLEPVLEKLLSPALEKGLRQLAILAPGSLRSLPILGLKVGGAPLYERVGAIHHLPSLEVDVHASDTGRLEACWLPAERERGDTSFGEAAIQTMRRWFTPVVIRPPATLGRDIEEVHQLDPLGPSFRSLRIYATSHIASTTPSSAAFVLEGGRAFSARDTRGLMIPDCQIVELWAATAGSGPVETIRRDDRDHIPGLAGEFLACGASAVLDLAWPIFDLVKALVCERYGIARRLPTLDDCAALLEAISSTATLLGKLRDATPSFVDVKMALEFLDEDRRATASAAALDARAVVPFADHLDAPSLEGFSVETLVEEACNPVHLAAFRYWMWL